MVAYTRNNPLQQLDFDKMVGLNTTAENTASCKTCSIINAYIVALGMVGKHEVETIAATLKESKAINKQKGFPADNDLLSRLVAGVLGLPNYLIQNDTTQSDDSSSPAIMYERNDLHEHYVYRDSSGIVDSAMYIEHTGGTYYFVGQQTLSWKDLPIQQNHGQNGNGSGRKGSPSPGQSDGDEGFQYGGCSEPSVNGAYGISQMGKGQGGSSGGVGGGTISPVKEDDRSGTTQPN